jgi:hypothetical protein
VEENEKEKQRLLQLIEDLESKIRDRDQGSMFKKSVSAENFFNKLSLSKFKTTFHLKTKYMSFSEYVL